jgi:hypothetical protein
VVVTAVAVATTVLYTNAERIANSTGQIIDRDVLGADIEDTTDGWAKGGKGNAPIWCIRVRDAPAWWCAPYCKISAAAALYLGFTLRSILRPLMRP